MGCIASASDAVLILIEPAGPVVDLVLAVAIIIWSIPPLVRWRHLIWTKRLTVVAGIVFTADLVWRFVEPTGFAVVRTLMVLIAVLTCSAVWFVLPLARWRQLIWTKRLAAIGGIALATGLVILLTGPSKPGLLILAMATLIWSALPLARWRRWTWPKRLTAVAAILFLMLALTEFATGLFTQADQAYFAETAGWSIWALLYLAFLSYLGASLSRITAPSVTWVLIILGIVFLYIFPPLLAFLATNGNADFAHLVVQQFNVGIRWPSFLLSCLQYLLLTSVPILLIVLPETLRRRLSGVQTPTTVETLLLSQLTIGATLATGLYAITLHFAKGPLEKLGVDQLVFAAIAVVVLVGPFYRYIVTACWKHGIADVFNPRSWRAKQDEQVKFLRKAFILSESRSDRSTSPAPTPPGD